jgi:hypothetical protein
MRREYPQLARILADARNLGVTVGITGQTAQDVLRSRPLSPGQTVQLVYNQPGIRTQGGPPPQATTLTRARERLLETF